MKAKGLRYLIAAITLYTLGVAAIVAAHLIASNTYIFNVSISISRYAGMKKWSAVVYIFLSAAVCFCLFMFLRCVKTPRLYRAFGYIVIISMILISFFPHGAFGDFATDVHRVLSRELFVSMMLHTLSGVICFPKSRRFLITNIIALAADFTLLVIAVMSWETFMGYAFLCEFILISAYFASLLAALREA